MLIPPITSHLLAPFTLTPKKYVAASVKSPRYINRHRELFKLCVIKIIYAKYYADTHNKIKNVFYHTYRQIIKAAAYVRTAPKAEIIKVRVMRKKLCR